MRVRCSTSAASVFNSGRSLVLALLVLVFVAAVPLAHGQTIVRSFQSGTATLATNATTVTATISSVTTTQAILFFSTSTNSTAVSNFGITGTITNATTLTFARGGTGTAATIQWYVVEFSSGVTVQRGSTTIATGANTTNVAITAVNLANSFPIISTSQNTTAGNSLTSSGEVNASLTSTTQLRLSTGANVA